MFAVWGGYMTLKNTLEARMSYRIAKSKRRVFLREDFADLGRCYRQVSRVLGKFVKEDRLIKLGYGMYARSKISRVTGNVVTDAPLPWLAKEYLARRGIEVVSTKAETDLVSGKSTQVPTGRTIGVRGRISRKISFNGMSVSYEQHP